MAKRMYAKTQEIAWTTGIGYHAVDRPLRVVLVDFVAYTPNFATDEFLSHVPAGARYGTPQTITGITVTQGLLQTSMEEVEFPALTAPALEAALFYLWTGVEATSRLIGLDDDATGLPLPATNNNLVPLRFDVNFLFRIGSAA